jgi:hypothetical protein
MSKPETPDMDPATQDHLAEIGSRLGYVGRFRVLLGVTLCRLGVRLYPPEVKRALGNMSASVGPTEEE